MHTAEGAPVETPSDAPRSGQQTAVIASGRIGAAGLSALWLVVAARELSLTQFSNLALVLAIGSALYFLADAGYSPLLSAHVATVGAIQPAALIDAIRRRVIGCVLALAILVPAYLVSADGSNGLVPLLFFGSLVGNAVHGSVSSALRALGHSAVEAGNEVVSRATMVGLGWLALSHGGGVVAAVALYAAVDLGSAVVLSLIAVRWCRAHPAPLSPLPDLGWRAAVPITIGSGFSTIYGRLDTWLVGLRGAAGSAGLYAAAYRIVDAMRLPAHAAGAVTLADAQRFGDDGASLARRRALRCAGFMAVPAAVLFVVAEPLLGIAFGDDFAAAAPALRVLAVSAVFSAVVAVLGPLVAVRGGRRFAGSVGCVTALNLLANLVLIPSIGVTGAAWANLASEAVLALLFLWALRPSRDQVGSGSGDAGLANV